MTVSRSSHTALSVVVDPGPLLSKASWDLELRGPLDSAVLEHALEVLAPHDPARRPRLVRHGPDHHTLRLTRTRDASTASLAGRFADLLTRPSAADHPLAPAQYAVLARPEGHRYEAVLLDTAVPPDPGAVRDALHAVLTAHPQLRSCLDVQGGRLTGKSDRQDPLVEGEFTDEDGFVAAVAELGRTVESPTGPRLLALLGRDRSATGTRTDRLALVADALAVDEASWQVLLTDLTTALDSTGPRPSQMPDALPGWVDELRDLAADPDEVRHWGLVAERRARAVGARQSAWVSGAGDADDDGVRGARDGAQGAERHIGFAVDRTLTERITRGLARRLALTAGQVLTGVFALALARWQRVDEVALDVRSDPRADHPGLRRHVGRLTDVHPIQLTLDPGLDLLGQLAAVAGPLASGAGQAAGGAGFGACREWSPDPLLREALRELPPAQACLTLHEPAESGHGTGQFGPVPGAAPARLPHRLRAQAQIVAGRLHVGLDWHSEAVDGVTDTTVADLAELLRELLEELAEAFTAPIPSAFPATPQQSALYLEGDAQPGTGRHIEQIVWVWHGPLDVERFTAAWQSVFDRESVLRTAFTGGPEPQLLLHSRAAPEISSRIHHGGDLAPLLENDRLRGFDLRCPGPLRLTLLSADGQPAADTSALTRIVLTYHRALLDNWSAHILLREFYRAYLTGGTLPGGERRPDLRDYTAWIAAQDLGSAQEFWTRSLPPDGAASRPGRPAGATGLTGVGRSGLRLDPAETIRLARWAGLWGIAESSVLQAVWAMLIYRASGATAPASVCFAVAVPGRGIPLDGASRMLGPLRNSLLTTVDVDPTGTVPGLLRQLRDSALDMAAYEWVPGDLLHGPTGPGGAGDPAETVIVFEDPPHPVEGLTNELATLGIRAEFPGTVPARSALPIGLLAHHDPAGGLVLTGVHDRDVIGDDAAAELLAQSALLLRELPLWAKDSTTVGDVLKLLAGREVPRMAEPAGTGQDTPLRTLRAAQGERAGTICLIPPHGAPATCYDLLAHAYTGPQELLVLTDAAPPVPAEWAAGRSLLLGGFSGAGVPACDLARRLAADGGRPPRVVLAGASPDEWERIRHLARALEDAVASDA
jgi:hypothetical protein